MSGQGDQLAAHLRRLGNHALNELLLQLPKPRFAALVELTLPRPVLPAGLLLRFEPTPAADRWTVVACAPRRQLGTLTRHQHPSGWVAWRAWSRAGDPVQITGACWWRRRLDAGTALAWVTPASGARCLALAAYVRALPWECQREVAPPRSSEVALPILVLRRPRCGLVTVCGRPGWGQMRERCR